MLITELNSEVDSLKSGGVQSKKRKTVMALEGDDIHTFLKGVVSPDGLESPEQWASRVLQQKRPKFFASIVERFGSLSGLVGTNQPPNKDFTAALRKMIEDSQGK